MNKIPIRFKQFITIGIIFILCILISIIIISNSVSAAGSIDVTSPYSGQTVYQGQTCAIYWNSYNIGDTVKIELYKGSYYLTISSSTENDGYYSWTVPTDLTVGGSYYSIKISNITGTVWDYSGYFSVSSRSIHVNSPYSGNTWYQGQTYTISWSSDNAGNIAKIELYNSGSYHSTINSRAYFNNGGSYSWTIPTNIAPGSSYQVKVISDIYSNIYDYSDYFTIDERTITITSPDESDILYRGESSTISWTSDVSGYVYIELYKDNSFYSYIETSTYNDGEYIWTLQSNLQMGSTYQIKITSKSYSSVYDYSDYFTIDERYIVITNPTNKVIFYKGEEEKITWDSKNAGNFVKIQLYQGYYSHSTIKSNTTNDGSYFWTIPSDLKSDSYYMIKISGMPDNAVYDESESFYIDERALVIISPSGGETWYIGETYTIKWNSENIGDVVKIDLYEDSSYHSAISTNTSNDGYYSWTVPNNLNLSSDYSLKIASDSYEEVFEYSSGYIAIEKPIIQSWLGNLILLICLIIFLAVFFILIKKDIIKLPKLKKSNHNNTKTQNSMDNKRNIKEEIINQEEYEHIWEKQ